MSYHPDLPENPDHGDTLAALAALTEAGISYTIMVVEFAGRHDLPIAVLPLDEADNE